MNYTLKSIIFILSLFILISCAEESKPAENTKFKDDLQSFNKSMEKVDQTMNVIGEMQDEMDKIDKEMARGTLSEKEAAIKKEKVNEEYSRELAKSANMNPARRLPDWAHKLGLIEPQGLRVDRDISQTTSENNPAEGYNSVLLIYYPNYETAMQQAAIIAEKADIPMSKDYVMAKQMEKEIGEVILRGIAYMNFELGSDDLPQYTIAITVDENGVLAISANDAYKMNEQLNR